MQKDFDKWNENKKNIHYQAKQKLFLPREIWWCICGINVGREQDGGKSNFERPIVVIKKLSPDTFIAAPLSTKKRMDQFQAIVTFGKLVNYGLLDQIRVLDSKRLVRKIGMMEKSEFEALKRKLIGLLS